MQHDNIKTGRGETMAEDKNSKVTQNQDRINKLIDGLTLFDDDLMSRVFDKNIEATELLLRIILERKIKVISVIGQEEMKSAAVGGRNITLDVHALDENGEKMDIELINANGWRWIRTTEANCSRFTVCPLWPLGNPSMSGKVP
jgi:hypothetical protein